MYLNMYNQLLKMAENRLGRFRENVKYLKSLFTIVAPVTLSLCIILFPRPVVATYSLTKTESIVHNSFSGLVREN